MINPLKWIARPIIPLIYGESLSYMEMVGKCVEKINEIIVYIQTTLLAQFDEELSKLVLSSEYDESTETLTINFSTSGDDS